MGVALWRRMCRRFFWKAAVTVTTLTLITLFSVKEEYVIPYLSDSLSFFVSPSNGSLCKCWPASWTESDLTAEYLNLPLPWLGNSSTLQELSSRHPNLAIEMLYDAKHSRCSLLPTLFSIEWRNRHWQQATLDDSSKFYLYSAFFDPETDGKASIRLLGVSKRRFPTLAWCHIWFSPAAPPFSVKVTNRDYLDHQSRNSDRQMPFLLRCPLPPNTTGVPLATSLTSKPCGKATNLLRVTGGMERDASAYREVPDNPKTLVKRWMSAVCGPALYYYHEDISIRLVEWLEILRAQGFGQVFLYVTHVHPNITKVLHHYVQEGFVQVTDYRYPPPYLNDPSLQRSIKNTISMCFKVPFLEEDEQQQRTPGKKRCALCPWSKKQSKVRATCKQCKRPICPNHSALLCSECIE